VELLKQWYARGGRGVSWREVNAAKYRKKRDRQHQDDDYFDDDSPSAVDSEIDELAVLMPVKERG
jgi:hypothetical protein